MKVLALTKYSSLAAGTRQRFLQYQPALEAAGIDLHCSPLFGNDYLVDVLAGRRASRTSIAAAYWRRLKAIANTGAADVVWLHCEFLPYWPGAAESFAARVIGHRQADPVRFRRRHFPHVRRGVTLASTATS
jgi:hypothetical protein